MQGTPAKAEHDRMHHIMVKNRAVGDFSLPPGALCINQIVVHNLHSSIPNVVHSLWRSRTSRNARSQRHRHHQQHLHPPGLQLQGGLRPGHRGNSSRLRLKSAVSVYPKKRPPRPPKIRRRRLSKASWTSIFRPGTKNRLLSHQETQRISTSDFQRKAPNP